MFRKPATPHRSAADLQKPVSHMSPGQRSYEAKRAADAGMTLEAWLGKKAGAAARAAVEKRRTQTPVPASKPKGLLGRLIERAHKPLR